MSISRKAFTKKQTATFKSLIFKGNALSQEEIRHVQNKCEELVGEVSDLLSIGLEVESLSDVYGSHNQHCSFLDELMPKRGKVSVTLSHISLFVAHFLADAPQAKTALAKSLLLTRRDNGGKRSNSYGDALRKALGFGVSSSKASKMSLQEEQKALIAQSKAEKWSKKKLQVEVKKLRARHQTKTKKK